MDNNKLLLELFERVIVLESEIDKIKKNLEKKEYEDNNVEKTRNDFRNDVIQKLAENNTDKYNFRVASRKEGSGIAYDLKGKSGKEETEAYKLYTSKEKDQKSWFKVEKKDIEEIINNNTIIKGIIFYSYISEDENIVLILNSSELKQFMVKKGNSKPDQTGGYHFYIQKKEINGNIQIIENRDKENVIDMTQYYNKFELI